MKARELYNRLDFLGRTQQNWTFSYLTGRDYGDVFLDNPHLEVENEKLERIIQGYCEGIPLAYLLGESHFYGRRFTVNSHVLIPRPETEGLVERALALPWKTALDLCTGSGVIAITLFLERRKPIQAVDLSGEALEVARKNALDLCADVNFSKGDLFEGIDKRFDLVISNPPYIERAALKNLDVSRYEPMLALDGGDDGLDLIRRLIQEAPRYLNPGGYLLLEIGDAQGEDILCMAEDFYGKIERDLAGKPRYFIGRKKEIC